MKIQRNKHPDGRISNIVFGLCHIADGLVRAGSLGSLHTTFPLDYARYLAKHRFAKLKAAHCAAKKVLQDAGAVYEES